MILTWETVLGGLALLTAAVGVLRHAYTEALKLAVEQMKNESLRAIQELREDSDQRYTSKAETSFIVQQMHQIQETCSRRHEGK